MTQLEILKFAQIGISIKLDLEKRRKERLNEDGIPTPITDRKLDRFTKFFDECGELIGIEERKQGDSK